MANILVTGANGQLGSELKKIGFTNLDTVFYRGRKELDITKIEDISNFVRGNDIDTIINCAAYTDVDKAEDEEEKAQLINGNAVGYLAKVALDNDCLLIHISTDYVFDGNSENPLDENAIPSPTNAYGRTKLYGEKEIITSKCMYIIIRTAWLYSSCQKNFVLTILKLAKEKDEINVVSDQIGSPTYAYDLANTIVSIMNSFERIEHTGIYHFTNEGQCSWYEFAKEIVKESGYECKVKPISSQEYPTKATRPKWSVLKCNKLKSNFRVSNRNWKDALKSCMSVIKENK